MTMVAATLQATGPAATVLALVAADGTVAADHARALLDPATPMRDLADAIHAVCVLHGSLPGVVDHARTGCTDSEANQWLAVAADAMAAERALLARLTAAVGPLPSTPGQAASENAVMAQRHALEMLAKSDRNGCAIGTAIAFVLDWQAVRSVLDAGALRIGQPRGANFMPTVRLTRDLLDRLVPTFPTQRAMVFGAQQMLAQHRGLWHLLEARASARDRR
jgi:hypothetical protein